MHFDRLAPNDVDVSNEDVDDNGNNSSLSADGDDDVRKSEKNGDNVSVNEFAAMIGLLVVGLD